MNASKIIITQGPYKGYKAVVKTTNHNSGVLLLLESETLQLQPVQINVYSDNKVFITLGPFTGFKGELNSFVQENDGSEIVVLDNVKGSLELKEGKKMFYNGYENVISEVLVNNNQNIEIVLRLENIRLNAEYFTQYDRNNFEYELPSVYQNIMKYNNVALVHIDSGPLQNYVGIIKKIEDSGNCILDVSKNIKIQKNNYIDYYNHDFKVKEIYVKNYLVEISANNKLVYVYENQIVKDSDFEQETSSKRTKIKMDNLEAGIQELSLADTSERKSKSMINIDTLLSNIHNFYNLLDKPELYDSYKNTYKGLVDYINKLNVLNESKSPFKIPVDEKLLYHVIIYFNNFDDINSFFYTTNNVSIKQLSTVYFGLLILYTENNLIYESFDSINYQKIIKEFLAKKEIVYIPEERPDITNDEELETFDDDENDENNNENMDSIEFLEDDENNYMAGFNDYSRMTFKQDTYLTDEDKGIISDLLAAEKYYKIPPVEEQLGRLLNTYKSIIKFLFGYEAWLKQIQKYDFDPNNIIPTDKRLLAFVIIYFHFHKSYQNFYYDKIDTDNSYVNLGKFYIALVILHEQNSLNYNLIYQTPDIFKYIENNFSLQSIYQNYGNENINEQIKKQAVPVSDITSKVKHHETNTELSKFKKNVFSSILYPTLNNLVGIFPNDVLVSVEQAITEGTRKEHILELLQETYDIDSLNKLASIIEFYEKKPMYNLDLEITINNVLNFLPLYITSQESENPVSINLLYNFYIQNSEIAISIDSFTSLISRIFNLESSDSKTITGFYLRTKDSFGQEWRQENQDPQVLKNIEQFKNTYKKYDIETLFMNEKEQEIVSKFIQRELNSERMTRTPVLDIYYSFRYYLRETQNKTSFNEVRFKELLKLLLKQDFNLSEDNFLLGFSLRNPYISENIINNSYIEQVIKKIYEELKKDQGFVESFLNFFSNSEDPLLYDLYMIAFMYQCHAVEIIETMLPYSQNELIDSLLSQYGLVVYQNIEMMVRENIKNIKGKEEKYIHMLIEDLRRKINSDKENPLVDEEFFVSLQTLLTEFYLRDKFNKKDKKSNVKQITEIADEKQYYLTPLLDKVSLEQKKFILFYMKKELDSLASQGLIKIYNEKDAPEVVADKDNLRKFLRTKKRDNPVKASDEIGEIIFIYSRIFKINSKLNEFVYNSVSDLINIIFSEDKKAIDNLHKKNFSLSKYLFSQILSFNQDLTFEKRFALFRYITLVYNSLFKLLSLKTQEDDISTYLIYYYEIGKTASDYSFGKYFNFVCNSLFGISLKASTEFFKLYYTVYNSDSPADINMKSYNIEQWLDVMADILKKNNIPVWKKDNKEELNIIKQNYTIFIFTLQNIIPYVSIEEALETFETLDRIRLILENDLPLDLAQELKISNSMIKKIYTTIQRYKPYMNDLKLDKDSVFIQTEIKGSVEQFLIKRKIKDTVNSYTLEKLNSLKNIYQNIEKDYQLTGSFRTLALKPEEFDVFFEITYFISDNQKIAQEQLMFYNLVDKIMNDLNLFDFNETKFLKYKKVVEIMLYLDDFMGEKILSTLLTNKYMNYSFLMAIRTNKNSEFEIYRPDILDQENQGLVLAVVKTKSEAISWVKKSYSGKNMKTYMELFYGLNIEEENKDKFLQYVKPPRKNMEEIWIREYRPYTLSIRPNFTSESRIWDVYSPYDKIYIKEFKYIAAQVDSKEKAENIVSFIMNRKNITNFITVEPPVEYFNTLGLSYDSKEVWYQENLLDQELKRDVYGIIEITDPVSLEDIGSIERQNMNIENLENFSSIINFTYIKNETIHFNTFPLWKPKIKYFVKDTVLLGENIYICTRNHFSSDKNSPSFENKNWELLFSENEKNKPSTVFEYIVRLTVNTDCTRLDFNTHISFISSTFNFTIDVNPEQRNVILENTQESYFSQINTDLNTEENKVNKNNENKKKRKNTN